MLMKESSLQKRPFWAGLLYAATRRYGGRLWRPSCFCSATFSLCFAAPPALELAKFETLLFSSGFVL